MQAYKLKGAIDQSGHLIITEPIEIPAGDVEIIILQSNQAPTEEVSAPEAPKKREYKVQALKDLLIVDVALDRNPYLYEAIEGCLLAIG